MSTTLELLVMGMITGTLPPRVGEMGWSWRVEGVPGYQAGEQEPCMVLRTPSGVEVVVTVYELRAPEGKGEE